MPAIVEKCREVIRGREGEFLTMLIGNPSLYTISNSEHADMLVDCFMQQNPNEFIERVGQYLLDEVEVA